MGSPEMSAANNRLDTMPGFYNIGSGYARIIHRGRT
jgi:hypothetical protein